MTGTYDLFSESFFADPYPTCAQMREKDPVYYDTTYDMWFVSRHRDIVAFTRDRRFSSARVEPFFAGVDPALSAKVDVIRDFLNSWMVFMDPPAHTAVRKLTALAFMPRTIAGLAGFVRQIVDDTLDGLAGSGGFDLIRDFSFPIPSRVISHMLGVRPQDADLFEGWVHDIFRMTGMVGDRDENVRAAYDGVVSLSEYFRDLIAQRRARPVDDLLGVLVRAEESGETLTEHQLVATCALLLLAGHETTTNLIANGVIAMLRHPAQLARLRSDPDLIEAAVEECLRYDGPAGGLARATLEDVEIGGVPIAAGQVVIGLPWAANRDPETFPDPDRFLIDRPNARHHLGLGSGPHVCLGAALARLEARTAFAALLQRFPDMALTAEPLTWVQSLAIRGVSRLPVAV